jgi:hypothetical protein
MTFACPDCDYPVCLALPRCPERGSPLDEEAARAAARPVELSATLGASTTALLLRLAAGLAFNILLLALLAREAWILYVVAVLVLIVASLLPGPVLGLTVRPGLRRVYATLWVRNLLWLHVPWVVQPAIITAGAGLGFAVGNGEMNAPVVLLLVPLAFFQIALAVVMPATWSSRWVDLAKSVRLWGNAGIDLAMLAADVVVFLSAAVGAVGGVILASTFVRGL